MKKENHIVSTTRYEEIYDTILADVCKGLDCNINKIEDGFDCWAVKWDCHFNYILDSVKAIYKLGLLANKINGSLYVNTGEKNIKLDITKGLSANDAIKFINVLGGKKEFVKNLYFNVSDENNNVVIELITIEDDDKGVFLTNEHHYPEECSDSECIEELGNIDKIIKNLSQYGMEFSSIKTDVEEYSNQCNLDGKILYDYLKLAY